MTISIRPLEPSDYPRWQELWRDYQDFYDVQFPHDVTATTWARLIDPAEPVHGLAATDGSKLTGFAHFVFHRTTWLTSDTCYLQDLYVEPAERGRGAARALIAGIYARADEQGAGQVYWLTHETNTAARRLYDQVATCGGFISYERFVETGPDA